MNGEFVISYSSADVPFPDDCRVTCAGAGGIEYFDIEDGRDIIAEWKPENVKDVAIELTLYVGLKVAGKEQSETTLFYTAVYTHAALDRIRRQGRFKIDTRHCIVVHEFDWPKIKLSIENILRKCERKTFEDSVTEIAKRFGMEYGD